MRGMLRFKGQVDNTGIADFVNFTRFKLLFRISLQMPADARETGRSPCYGSGWVSVSYLTLHKKLIFTIFARKVIHMSCCNNDNF